MNQIIFCNNMSKITIYIITVIVIVHDCFGKHAKTSSENLLCGTSCSSKITSFSASLSPIFPSDRT